MVRVKASGKELHHLYLRVSGSKSVESNLSIPDQEAQLRLFCKRQGWIVVAVYIEPGVSAKTVHRPQFQRMIRDAQQTPTPFSIVLVHNTARFARSTRDFASFESLLARHGIELLFVSQSFAKDAGGMVAKRVTTVFDEYHSFRSAEDSIRARRFMVADGYWPGGPPPDGYKLVPATSNPRRKWVVIDVDRQWVVKKVYSLALHGDGQSPPMGVKAIARWLNSRGVRTRNDALWSTQAVHKMLTNGAYFGDYYWGISATADEFRERKDPVLLRIPPIISRQKFEEMQLLLEKRNPEMGAAKLVSSPLLLAGLARCKCGASMTLGTGTGKNGHVYRFYRCSDDNRGKNECTGPWVSQEHLDKAVLEAVTVRVLDNAHLTDLLVRLQEREATSRAAAEKRVPELQDQFSAARTAVEGLLASIKLVPALGADPLFKKELESTTMALTTARTRLHDALENPSKPFEITTERVALFRSQMEDLLHGENRAVAKIFLSTIVAGVEIGEHSVRIFGHIVDLRDAVRRTCIEDETAEVSGVRRYVRRWRRGSPFATCATTRVTKQIQVFNPYS